MNVEIPDHVEPATVVSGKTWAELDKERVNRLVTLVASTLLPAFENASLKAVIYKPAHEHIEDAPDGFIELWFTAHDGLEALVAIEFAGVPEWLEYEMEDWSLEAALANARTADALANTVTFYNFDEAMFFVCAVGERLGISEVKLQFGV